MAQQAVVTDYFTRRRQREAIQASKRKRTGSTTQNDDISELKAKKDEISSIVKVKKPKETKTKPAKTPARVTRATTRKTKKSAYKTIEGIYITFCIVYCIYVQSLQMF